MTRDAQVLGLAILGLVLFLAFGCGSGTEPGGSASLVVISGDGQRAEVGKELPEAVVVKVTDGQGRPIANQIVNFQVISGGGSVFAGVAQTNSRGEARERWTLGTVAGEQLLEARAVDPSSGESLVFGRVTATALPGPMKFFRFVGGGFFLDQQLDIASVVEARDQYGNIIPDVPITVTAEPPFRVEGTKLSSSTETTSRVSVTSGEFTISQEFAAFRNLTSMVGATGSWTCDGVGGMGQVHQSTTLVVDSVRYFSSLTVRMYFTATAVNTMHDQSTHTATWSGTLQATQVPRHLQWGFPEGPILGTAELISESPVTYVGGNGCYGWNPSVPGDFTLIKQ